KAISTLRRSLLLIAHQLCQNTTGRLRMDERHLEPEEAPPRYFVDQLSALGAQAAELGAEIVDVEGDVVQARPALGEELPDRRLGPEGPEQLDPAPTHMQRRCLDALLLDGLAMLERRAEE